MVDAGGVEGRGPALDAVDLIALGEQQLGQIGAVLAGDAGDQCHFGHIAFLDFVGSVRLPEPNSSNRRGLAGLRPGQSEIRRHCSVCTTGFCPPSSYCICVRRPSPCYFGRVPAALMPRGSVHLVNANAGRSLEGNFAVQHIAAGKSRNRRASWVRPLLFPPAAARGVRQPVRRRAEKDWPRAAGRLSSALQLACEEAPTGPDAADRQTRWASAACDCRADGADVRAPDLGADPAGQQPTVVMVAVGRVVGSDAAALGGGAPAGPWPAAARRVAGGAGGPDDDPGVGVRVPARCRRRASPGSSRSHCGRRRSRLAWATPCRWWDLTLRQAATR